MTSDKYIDNVFDGLKQIREIKDEMNDLAKSFSITGNHDVSQKLGMWCHRLDMNADQIQHAVAKEINRRSGNTSFNDCINNDDEVKHVNDIIGMGD